MSSHEAKVPLGKPLITASMGHFKLVGGPKWKNYRPRRRLQYQKAQLRVLVSHTEASHLNH